jgi:hypothetical protein
MYLLARSMDTKLGYRKQIHLGLLILSSVPSGILMVYPKIHARR